METDRIRYFCAIADAGSLTRAAELLGVSHSGLSKAMSALQDELGYKVFLPKGRGLELSPQGRDFYVKGRKILELLSSLKEPSRGSESPLRVALPEALALATAQAVVTDFADGLTIEDLDSGEIEERVLTARSDFGFTFVPFPHRDLDHLKVVSVTLASFARTGAFRGLDPDQIPYVIPSYELRENPLSIRTRDGWNPVLSRLTPLKASSLSLALEMAKTGTCAIYTPEFVVAHHNENEEKARQLKPLDLVSGRRLKERSQRDIFMVKRANEEETRSMKLFAKIVRHRSKKQVL